MVYAAWAHDEQFETAKNIIQTVLSDQDALIFTREVSGERFWLLVYDGDEAVGAGELILGEYAYAGPVVVLERYRGQGLGGLAARVIIRRAFDSGYTKQYTQCKHENIRFCEKLGFIVAEDKNPRVIMSRAGDVGGHCSVT